MKKITSLFICICLFLIEKKIFANEPVMIPQLTIEQLRIFNPELTNVSNIQKNLTAKYLVCYIVDNNKEGMFKLQIISNFTEQNYKTNITNDDDGVMTIVAHPQNSSLYFRYTRIVDRFINVKWFGSCNNLQKISQQPQNKIEEFIKLFNKYSPFETTTSKLYNDISSNDLAMKFWQENTLDWFALQTAINYCVNSQTNKTLFIPLGNYNISRELFIHKSKSPDSYGQCQIVIEGESSYSGAVGTTIAALFNDKFALGLQEGRGIKIRGLSFSGQFTRDNNVTMGNRDFYSSTLETDGNKSYNRFFKSCKDRRFGPYAAIVLDPFRINKHPRGNIENYNDYYSELEYCYTKKCGTSSGTEITDIQINGFVAGIVFSPNGLTQGNDVSKIEKTKFSNLKYAICFSQDQEKTNTIRHIYAWYNVHTVIASSAQKTAIRVAYGQGRSGNQIIDDINLAGNVNQFIYRDDGGTFPLFVKNFFSEGLGKLGYLGSFVGGSFEDSHIGFYYPIINEDSNYQGLYPDWHINGNGFTFKNCVIRYYTEGDQMRWPISIKGNFKFENCVFTTVPYYYQPNGGDNSLPTFINCTTSLEGDFGFSGTKSIAASHFYKSVSYGSFTLNNYTENKWGYKKQMKYNNPIAYELFGIETIKIDSVKKNGDVEIIVKKENLDSYFRFSKLIVYSDNVYGPFSPLGIIKKFDTTTNKITVSGVNSDMISKKICITSMIPIVTIEPFWADIKTGVGSKIYNVRKDNFIVPNNSAEIKINPSYYIGKVINIKNGTLCTNLVKIKDGDYRPFSTRDYVIIKNYDTATNCFDVSLLKSDKDYSKVYFCNSCEKVYETKDSNTPKPNNN